MSIKLSRTFVGAILAASIPTAIHGQILFFDDFDANHTANWMVNNGPGNNPADFFFDYSSVGIPSAPHSTGGSTLGMKLQANVSGNVFGGVSVSPLGQSFTGNYRLRFDMWMNYQGPLLTGGNGTTQAGGAGIGTAGTSAQWAGGTQDSLYFDMTGDGGSTQDYRVYPVGPLAAPASGYYAAGTATTPIDARNDTHPYYQGLGAKTAPPAMTALFPTQTGATRPGAAGYAWRDMVIDKSGSTVTWTMDGLLIATVDASSLSLGGNNILLNYFDTNASSSTDATATSLLFGLIDNVTVTVIPEPSSFALILLGAAAMFGVRRPRK